MIIDLLTLAAALTAASFSAATWFKLREKAAPPVDQSVQEWQASVPQRIEAPPQVEPEPEQPFVESPRLQPVLGRVRAARQMLAELEAKSRG